MTAEIETSEARQLRSRRQAFAAPGGFHDRLVRFLGLVLPMGVGILAAFMVITPLSPRGEVSFLLDRNKVEVIENRLRVDAALYRGSDKQGRPFSLTAGEAVQRSAAEGVVRMQDLVARILLNDGPASLSANAGRYDIAGQQVGVIGPVRFEAADGYRISASNVSIDLPGKKLVGTGGIQGEIPAGTFSADTIEANLNTRVIALQGNARLRMEPGKLRMP